MSEEGKMKESRDLVVLVENSGMEKTKAQTVLETFTGFFAQASDWEAKAKSLVITDVSQIHEMKMAREGRLQLKEIRVAAEKTKKKLKENILVEGRFIDSIYNLIEGVTKPIENDLLEKEKFVERKEQARKDALSAERVEKLLPYEIDTSFYNLAEMPDAAFSQLLENTRMAYESRLAAERKAEDDRIAREKAEQEERARIAAENIRLKAEAEAREKAIEAERKAREEADRIEFEKREAEERKAAAIREAERQKQEAALRAEREATEKAQRELRAKIEAEEREKREEAARILAEQKAKEEAERRIAAASDNEKIIAYIRQIKQIQEPAVNNIQARSIMDDLRNAIDMTESRARI